MYLFLNILTKSKTSDEVKNQWGSICNEVCYYYSGTVLVQSVQEPGLANFLSSSVYDYYRNVDKILTP